MQVDIFTMGVSSMIFYIAFTTAWTLIVIGRSSMWRRINRISIHPIVRHLSYRGVPEVVQQLVTGVLQLSIIPLGFVWASVLMMRSLRTD
jgi:hypothetical protein